MKEIVKRVYNEIVYFFENKRKIEGKNNRIIRANNSYLQHTHISMYGNNNTLIFKESCNICGVRILVIGNDNIVEFGKNVTINASTIHPTVINAVGGGKSIKIGDGSLLSNNIEIHTSDYHGIYNSQGKRVNPDKNILIGK